MKKNWDELLKGWSIEIATDAEMSQYCSQYYQELITEDEPEAKS